MLTRDYIMQCTQAYRFKQRLFIGGRRCHDEQVRRTIILVGIITCNKTTQVISTEYQYTGASAGNGAAIVVNKEAEGDLLIVELVRRENILKVNAIAYRYLL